MARIRTIKPEFFRHEGLQDLESANPGAYCMLVFAGLWGHCDKAGRFEWKPRTLKLDILPFIEFSMANTLAILESAGFLRRYVSGEKEYGEIASFEKHQRISGKEAQEPTKHPSPLSYEHGSNGEAIGKQLGLQEGKGREEEGKGEESEQSTDGARKKHGSEEDHKTAHWMFERVQKICATAKVPSWDGWANDIRLMREIDKVSHAEICELFDWANKDSFWCANIMSPAKLRAKWQTLVAQRARNASRGNGRPSINDMAGPQRDFSNVFNEVPE